MTKPSPETNKGDFISGGKTYQCKKGHTFENCFGPPMTVWGKNLCSKCWGEWMVAQGWELQEKVEDNDK